MSLPFCPLALECPEYPSALVVPVRKNKTEIEDRRQRKSKDRRQRKSKD